MTNKQADAFLDNIECQPAVSYAKIMNPNDLRAACANLLIVVEGMKLVAKSSAHMFGNGYRAALDSLTQSQCYADISRIIAAPTSGDCQQADARPQPVEESRGEAACPPPTAEPCDCSPFGLRCLATDPDPMSGAICSRPRGHNGAHRACGGNAPTRTEWL